MQKEDCFLLGTVFKLHGYKGNVKIYSDYNTTLDFKSIECFLIEKNTSLVPFFISHAKYIKANTILVKFEEINSEKDARSLLSRKVYLLKGIHEIVARDKKYEEKLIGFEIIDSKLGKIGTVKYVNTQTPQKLIFVSNGEKEFCFPMHENFIIKINELRKLIQVEIPEELIHLN
jgi:16S rRNA processing protein RimM